MLVNCDQIFMCLANADNLALGVPFMWGKVVSDSWCDMSTGNTQYYFEFQYDDSMLIEKTLDFDWCEGKPKILKGCVAKALTYLFKAQFGLV